MPGWLRLVTRWRSWPAAASSRPAEIGAVDLVLVGVKLWATLEAAEASKPLLGPSTAVVSFQNGVVKDDILRQTLGAEHVIGGVCYVAATIAEPGLIRHSGTMAKLVFGEYDGSLSPRVRQFRDACADSGIDAEISDHIEQAIWEKFVFLVGLSGTTSLARSAIGPIRSHPGSRAFLHDTTPWRRWCGSRAPGRRPSAAAPHRRGRLGPSRRR